MSWLATLLFPRRTTREAELIARAEHYRGRADRAEATATAALSNQRRMAADLDNREQRLEVQAQTIADLRARLDSQRPERASVARLREELEKQKRVNDRLSNQLLDATGYNGQPLTDAARAKLDLPAEVKP